MDMARKLQNNVQDFDVKKSEIVEETERILNAPLASKGQQQVPMTENLAKVTETPMGVAQPIRKQKMQKTENGVTVYVPMDYYERMMIMKMRTGIPIKDLALQAIMEFMDRHK